MRQAQFGRRIEFEQCQQNGGLLRAQPSGAKKKLGTQLSVYLEILLNRQPHEKIDLQNLKSKTEVLFFLQHKKKTQFPKNKHLQNIPPFKV